jgi:FKBP-type peptidyl-prolyl cis-trans isomerase 2
MVMLQKGDFIEIEYTGKIKEDNSIFDTTDPVQAKKLDIQNENMSYGPVTICLGESQVLKGMDDYLIGKESGKSYVISLKPEEAFGKKNAKLFKIVSMSMFVKQEIMPAVGLQITVDGVLGTVRSVTGGRVVLDFNHPLSGREVVYDVTVKDVVTDTTKQLKSFVNLSLGLKDSKVEITNDEATVSVPTEVPKEVQETLSKKILSIIKIKKVDFVKEIKVKKDVKPTEKAAAKPAEKSA